MPLRNTRRTGTAALRGIMPALVSPHDGRNRFLPDVYERQLAFVYQAEIHGVYVCGGTGEGSQMATEERKEAAQIAVRASQGRGKAIIHVGAASMQEAQALAEHAGETGADAIASVPPAGREGGELVRWYKTIAEASRLPVLIYHIPAVTGRTMTMGEFDALLRLPGVCGLKFTDSNLFLLWRLLDRYPRAVVFNGSDEMVAPGILYGAHGGIGTWYNLIPELFVGIWKKAEHGDYAAAMDLQARFLRLSDVAWELGLLEVFDMLMRRRGIVRHMFRRPFQPFTRAQEREAWVRLRPLCEDLGLRLK